MTTADNFNNIRRGSEPIERQMAVDFRQPYRQHLSKTELRALVAEAFANTAKLEIQRTPNKPKRGER
jgi:hypothetical protein